MTYTGAAFAVIVLLLRMRWNLGLVMLVNAVFLGALYGLGPHRQAEVVFQSSIDQETINLVVGLVRLWV